MTISNLEGVAGWMVRTAERIAKLIAAGMPNGLAVRTHVLIGIMRDEFDRCAKEGCHVSLQGNLTPAKNRAVKGGAEFWAHVETVAAETRERKELHNFKTNHQQGREIAMSGSNYVANDEVFPTRVMFKNGRVVEIKTKDNGTPYLSVEMWPEWGEEAWAREMAARDGL